MRCQFGSECQRRVQPSSRRRPTVELASHDWIACSQRAPQDVQPSLRLCRTTGYIENQFWDAAGLEELTYQVRIVSIKVNELFWVCKFFKHSSIALAFVAQRNRSIRPSFSSDTNVPTITSNSENVLTQADSVTTTWSTRMSDARARFVLELPS